MRLWSVHPRYLDSKGLVALWREALLAQNVLRGNTKGYKNHPQLTRFKESSDPVGAIASYLVAVADEADKRGYNFNRSKIAEERSNHPIKVTRGQVDYEKQHLLTKLKKRAPDLYQRFKTNTDLEVHPLFKVVGGEIEEWEIL